MAKKLVKNYVFTPGVSVDDNILPNAYSLISQNRQFLIKEIVAFIQNLVTAGDSSYVGYTFNTVKCERDSGYVIDALLHDLRYGGNEEIRYVASQYWDGTVAQIDGNRIPEYEGYEFIRDLITTNILTNTLDVSPEQALELQVIDGTKTAEAGSYARVQTLLTNVKEVIENGLGSLPAESIALGRIEILGKVELEDILLISNVTDNVVIYNFAEPAKGGTVQFNEGNSSAYPNAVQVNNGTTVIRFKYNTSAMSSSDSIQVFLENTEIKTRPYDFGTDAIERMRVAQPQAMLDADFEYGLQPTKWQAIGTQRGYPATYEVSATDITVSTIVTDASTGTGGIGGSLITVTTTSSHGLQVGQAISIRALASSITGFARAEGTFIIYSVPSGTTFTYYAKAKVGTSNGQLLATSTSQLRQAAFYTGASVGQPIFSVYSNGSSGSFTTALRTESGQNTLAFVGLAPPVGAPLSGTGITAGTQIAGVFGPSNSDGIVDYRYVRTTYGGGATSIDLVDVSGIQAGMAVGNEASPNILREITSIGGITLSLSGTVTVGKTGDQSVYNGAATPVTSSGLNAFFNISVSSGVYSISGIGSSGGGSDWVVGDTALITGDFLGGATPANDLYINISSVSGGAVTGASIVQGTGTGTGTFNDIEAYGDSSKGSGGGNWFITRANGTYSLTAFPGSAGTKYYVGNRFKIPGTSLEGTTPANDVILRIDTVSAPGGYPTAASITSGTAARGDQIPIYATVTLSENTSAIVPATTTISYSSIATIQVAFPSNHGFVPGMGLNIAISSVGTNHALASGPFAVEEIVAPNVIRYTARSSGTIDTATLLQGIVYVRPDTFFTHRPFDGGVQLGTGGPQHGGQAIRQSKKYIRYQSGKGAMYNTGALFAPSFDIRSASAAATAAGSLITIVTDDVDHGLQAGSTVRLSGIQTTGYNGEYVVSEIVDERTFRVVAQTALGSTTGEIGSQCQMALLYWHGATVRSGPFDDQNGIFFQYDGQTLAVGRRSSTFQIAGTVAINADSNSVTGTNTRFLDQLQEGDRIVIRGMTHVVAGIASNTVMTVTPDFRGVNNVTGVKVCKIDDIIIPQSEWNLDKCDGTGPSGYNIDVTKMQMIGIQFSWYGAGFIDWMFRGPDGNYVFCHRLKGNNLNTEAYMRTGNTPVRYEVTNEGARNRLAAAINDSQTTITLNDVSDFPASGTVYIDNELISYSGRNLTANTLTGCTRAASLSNFAAGATRTYTAGLAASHAVKQGVVLVSCTTSPIISHWGSAYLIDGNFDEDRGYIFNYAATAVSASTTKRTAFLIRLAPSVSNAVVGDLGERELLNRAQLLLNALSITSDTVTGGGAIVVEGILNPLNYPLNPANITWNGLNSAAAGGQPSFAQIALGGSVVWGAAGSTSTATVAGATTTTVAAQGIALVTFSMTTRAIYSGISAFSGTNYFWILKSDYDGFTTKPLVGDGITGTNIPGSTTINTIQSWDSSYYIIYMSKNWTGQINGNGSVTVTNQISSNYNSAFRNGQRDFLITTSVYSSSGIQVGDRVNSANMSSTRVEGIDLNYVTLASTAYTRIRTADSASSTSTGGTNITTTVTANQTAASYSSTNFLFFTSASFIASGATVGTRLDPTVTQFPAGTIVSGVAVRTLGGTTIYRVTFSQTSNTSIAAAATITFTFGAEFALPGEQVFSFIANPGETSTLDLSALKELGTTAIGGRGTFPNGPDVLAINIFKVAGTATNCNLILRWGEAQA